MHVFLVLVNNFKFAILFFLFSEISEHILIDRMRMGVNIFEWFVSGTISVYVKFVVIKYHIALYEVAGGTQTKILLCLKLNTDNILLNSKVTILYFSY
jgi:hypothetical protein